MTTSDPLQFLDDGPFDQTERASIRAVHAAVALAEGTEELLLSVERNVALLDQLGALLGRYPSLFEAQSLGRRQRDRSSLVDRLSASNLSNFEMFLPTRALLGRALVMAEMNFYRLLRFVCQEALQDTEAGIYLPRIEQHLCQCIYIRLAGELLTNIASDESVERAERKKAVLALLLIWDRSAYRLTRLLPVLHATWEARRRVVVAGGTLLGTTEIFQLLQAGCDRRFVDLLIRPERTMDEATAFREFLFGATTEELEQLQERLMSSAESTISIGELTTIGAGRRIMDRSADPALAMFEFFLARHLQACARRQAALPGPKRTAEEYVMLHYLATLSPDQITAPERRWG